FITKLLHQSRHHFVPVLFAQARRIYCCFHYLITSPDFFDIRTKLPSERSRLVRAGAFTFASHSITLEMCMGASCFTIPPCGFCASGLLCLVMMLTPSTNTRPF